MAEHGGQTVDPAGVGPDETSRYLSWKREHELIRQYSKWQLLTTHVVGWIHAGFELQRTRVCVMSAEVVRVCCGRWIMVRGDLFVQHKYTATSGKHTAELAQRIHGSGCHCALLSSHVSTSSLVSANVLWWRTRLSLIWSKTATSP